MKALCKQCGTFYVELKESMTCPHLAFPARCVAHDRQHCGMPECMVPVTVLAVYRDQRKTAR